MNTKGITLFSLFGFKVKIDLSWLILGLLITWSLAKGVFPYYYPGLPTAYYWYMGAAGAVGLFFSIVLHELSHSLVARKYGLQIRGITLFIFGGVAEMSEEPKSPRVELAMAAAGPASSILIGAALYGAYYACRINQVPTPVTGLLGYLALMNFILAGFNLIPAFPLDGGRIFRSILWKWKKDLRWATNIASKLGSIAGIGLILYGIVNVVMGNFIGGMWYFLIGMFLRSAAHGSYQQVVIRNTLEGFPVRRFMNQEPVTVTADTSIEELVENFIYRHHYKMYPVIDHEKLLGCITIKDIKHVPKEKRSISNVRSFMSACGPDNTVGPDDDVMDALALMNRNRASRLMVVQDGKLTGMISLKDIMDFLAVKMDLAS
jgi:Zn-dependent protease/predicted transcriptional regulator